MISTKIIDFPTYIVSTNGTVFNTVRRNKHMNVVLTKPRKLKPVKRAKGYLAVTLHDRGRIRTEFIHVLVMCAFVGPKPSGLETAHLNGKPSDNRLENLAYVTRKENASHRARHGTLVHGADHVGAKLSWANARNIRRLRERGWLLKELAAKYSVSAGTIRNIVNYRSYLPYERAP